MRTRSVPICVLLCLLLMHTASGDVLKLANGGELKGTLKEVTFLVAGKEAQHAAADIQSVTVADTGRDLLVLKDGTKLEGELVGLRFRSIGGELAFERKDFATLTFGEDPLAAARKELVAKKAEVAAGDAKGLFELAVWCREKKLMSESVAFAKACLKVDPDGEYGKKARSLLGLSNNKVPEDPNKGKLTPEQLQALKDAAAKNEELYKTYLAKVGEIKTDELNAAKEKYNTPSEELKKKYDKLAATIDKKKKNRERARDDYKRRYGQYLTGSNTPKIKFNDGLAEDEAELRKTKILVLRLRKQAGREKSRVSSRARKRKDRVGLIRLRNQNSFRAGRAPSEEEMTKGYEAALRLE